MVDFMDGYNQTIRQANIAERAVVVQNAMSYYDTYVAVSLKLEPAVRSFNSLYSVFYAEADKERTRIEMGLFKLIDIVWLPQNATYAKVIRKALIDGVHLPFTTH